MISRAAAGSYRMAKHDCTVQLFDHHRMRLIESPPIQSAKAANFHYFLKHRQNF